MALVGARVIDERAVTITNTAETLEDLGFDPDDIAIADTITITVEAAARYSYGTSAPTTGAGHYIVAQVPQTIRAASFTRYMKFIRVGGSDVSGFVTLSRI
jgi:hypothetical protein